MLDLVIRNAVILDGNGGEQFRGDVAVLGDRIQAVVPPGDLLNEPARHEIDAAGACLAPGFIDSHTHSDIALLAEPNAASKVSQGVTTEIVGNCGWSVVPAGYPYESDYRRVGQAIFGYPETPWEWRDMHGYFEALRRCGTAVNIAALAGHGALRAAVMGFDERPPNESELAQMRYLLAEALQQGAIGLSSGLAYAPGCYAATDELIALAEVVAEHRGLYATHLRDQVDGLVESVQEALQIGREANIPVLISHHKTVGRNNFGKVQITLGMLDEVYADGVPTYSDIYPYLAGSSTMLPLLPPWVLAERFPPLSERLRNPEIRARIRRDITSGLEGWENRVQAVGWENIYIARVASRHNRKHEGKSIMAFANERGADPLNAMLDLLAEEDGDVSSLISNSCEEDLSAVMRHSRTMIGSDGIDVGEKPHPRLYGTFPRIFSEYVRTYGVLTLEEAVHRMTGLPAAVFGFRDRGLIRNGYFADLTLFDANIIRDTATYDYPRRFAEGIQCVWVAGEAVFSEGRPTERRPGRVLRREAIA